MRSAFLKDGDVELRGLSRDDIELYRGWLENADATHFMESGWRPIPDSEMEALIKSSTEPSDSAGFVVVSKSLGRPIGVCGLYLIQWICRRGEFRILIGDNEGRGQGIGTQAARLVVNYGFAKLNLETIYLGVNAENHGAIRSYEKAGFRPEGVRRRLIYRNGRYYDALMMSVLRDEWMAELKV